MSEKAVNKSARKKRLFQQRVFGIVLLLISGIVLYMTAGSQSGIECDASVILLTAPLGAYLLFTKKVVIN